jgi:S-adenosylmethionine decarboxylase proenzyme
VQALGRHLLCEYHGCNRELLNQADVIRSELNRAVTLAGATPLHEVVHAFSPHGVTGVVVIAESHFAIHTWPEHGFAAVDLFTCGDSVDPYRAFDHLRGALGAQSHSVVEIRRGLFPADVKHKP